MRPLGITILGILVVLAAVIITVIGVMGILVGLAFLVPGAPAPAGPLLLGGLTYFVIGLVLGISGTGLLRLRPWAWWLALLAAVGYLAYVAYGVYEDTKPPGPGLTLTSAVTLGVVGVILAYLVSVHRSFRRPAAVR